MSVSALARSIQQIPTGFLGPAARNCSAAGSAPESLDTGADLDSWRVASLGPEVGDQDRGIALTSRKVVTVLFHPFLKLWVLDHSQKLTWPPILGHFSLKFVWFCSGKKI